MVLLDTNVLSELMRPAPSEAVRAWLAAQPANRVFTTAITQAEILFGIAIMSAGHRRDTLRDRAMQMFAEEFEGRVLGFDGAAAAEFATISADRRRLGRPISTMDAQIAAIGRSTGASVASRNVSDFQHCGIDIIDPWAQRLV